MVLKKAVNILKESLKLDTFVDPFDSTEFIEAIKTLWADPCIHEQVLPNANQFNLLECTSQWVLEWNYIAPILNLFYRYLNYFQPNEFDWSDHCPRLCSNIAGHFNDESADHRHFRGHPSLFKNYCEWMHFIGQFYGQQNSIQSIRCGRTKDGKTQMDSLFWCSFWYSKGNLLLWINLWWMPGA